MSADPDFVKALQAEESRIEADLKLTPMYRRLEAVRASLRELMPVYAEGSAAEPFISPVVMDRLPPKTTDSIPNVKPGSISSIVSKTAHDLFIITGKRATSSDILSRVLAKEFKTENKKPQAQVASILSHNPLFDNTGDSHGSGYGLREWTVKETARANTNGQGAHQKTGAESDSFDVPRS